MIDVQGLLGTGMSVGSLYEVNDQLVCLHGGRGCLYLQATYSY